MTTGSSPALDEFELSLFGPGVGECALVHLGQGSWMVVDSCVDADTRNPIALDYLARIGVDPAIAIHRIVVTHWHDDHTRGIAQVYAAAPHTELVCSAALRTVEFKQALGASGTFPGDSGIDEMRCLFGELVTRSDDRHESIGPTWAMANMCLYRRGESTVHALSPSSSTFNRTLHEIGALIPQKNAPKRRAVSNRPNEVSVVLWIECGTVRALLGGDLERGRDAQSGWQAIVSSTDRPPGKAQIIKVPHHGADNADDPRIWSELLEMQPLATLTPFRRRGLPQKSDLARLNGYTENLYCTASQRGQRSKGHLSAVEKITRRVAPDLRRASGPMGHIRIRVSEGSQPRIETFGPAHRVSPT